MSVKYENYEVNIIVVSNYSKYSHIINQKSTQMFQLGTNRILIKMKALEKGQKPHFCQKKKIRDSLENNNNDNLFFLLYYLDRLNLGRLNYQLSAPNVRVLLMIEPADSKSQMNKSQKYTTLMLEFPVL